MHLSALIMIANKLNSSGAPPSAAATDVVALQAASARGFDPIRDI